MGVVAELRASVYPGSNQEIARDAAELADLVAAEHEKRFPVGGKTVQETHERRGPNAAAETDPIAELRAMGEVLRHAAK